VSGSKLIMAVVVAYAVKNGLANKLVPHQSTIHTAHRCTLSCRRPSNFNYAAALQLRSRHRS
jgi:hypothetical protein